MPTPPVKHIDGYQLQCSCIIARLFDCRITPSFLTGRVYLIIICKSVEDSRGRACGENEIVNAVPACPTSTTWYLVDVLAVLGIKSLESEVPFYHISKSSL